ncbi:hypothetical protein OF117_16280 [Geodermatophilus sp. YIM 151500]|uniref:ATP-binding protein n=1 Tax=Geodermatophilus sp. YIM 151500 TaxID=2984531 RepID=UPI0021E3DEE1|nr:BTAD domain-containing putative transcriptional regulator [Geodermatophilus sp. YIM 151500]MCV2490913.1 hypothetical protein [Geodermatophilus sp. YIM 151500]
MTAVGVLGPLLLAGPGGAAVEVGSARQRRLLAALAAHLEDGVATATLIELVWPEGAAGAPVDPVGAVQTNVARLRRLLPAPVRIATTSTGYRLVVARAELDATAFVDRLGAAPAAASPAERLEVLESALALWRGKPYAELDHPGIQPEVARLEQLHRDARERHAAALLATGQAGAAVAAAQALSLAEPLHEGAVDVLVRALVAVGRQAEALDALAGIRRRLAEELGLDPGQRLRDLERQVLRQEVAVPAAPRDPVRPAARPDVVPPPGLPVSSFVGREADVARVVALLPRRVVTLCGPGGVGKTRLARHVLDRVREGYADGAVLVELGAGGPDDVLPAVAAALRIADPGTGTLAERVVAALAVRRQLLVLDNCEHVADGAAALVEGICCDAPGVTVLATSREPLRVDGEQVVRLHPLQPVEAERLLVDRMRASDPARAPASDEPALVAELCRRLDGLPLTLELAGARAATLGLRELLAALTGSGDLDLELLRGGRRTAGRRHRSVHDVVEWSYGLLDDEERRLFVRLSVFAGAVEPEAVAAVCGSAAALPDLVDRSLVERTESGEDGRARFGLLETLRAFGRTRAATDPAAAELRARHAAWVVGLADDVHRARRGPGEAAAVRRFDEALPEIRRAHAWLCARGPLDQLLRLSLPIAELAWLSCRIDLLQLAERALQVADGLGGDAAGGSGPMVARLLGLLATADWQRGDLVAAEQKARRAMAVAADAGDPAAAGMAHDALANVHGFRGDLASARAWADGELALAESAGDRELALLARSEIMLSAIYGGDHDEAGRQERAMALAAGRLGSPTGRAWLAYLQGERRAEAGDPAAARYLAAAVREAEHAGSDFIAGIARHTLLTSATRGDGDPARALADLHLLVDHWHRAGAWTQCWVAVRALIDVLSRMGRHRDVARLLGALRASPRATRPFGADRDRESRAERAAREALGPTYDEALAAGAALDDAAAVALALRLTGVDGRTPTG